MFGGLGRKSPWSCPEGALVLVDKGERPTFGMKGSLQGGGGGSRNSI